MPTPSQRKELASVSIRPMREPDLVEVRKILRIAFGTFIGVPDPESFSADREYVFTRWHANPVGTLVAEVNDQLAGSNFATNWGSFGFFGPLTVRPEYWDRHVAQSLLAPTMDLFKNWQMKETGLFTFAHSPKHVALYQKFGFWPRFLTAIMSKGVSAKQASYSRYSAANEGTRAETLSACRELTDAIYEGLEVTSEIRSVQDQVWARQSCCGAVICLMALQFATAAREARRGRNTCYIKFAAVRPGPGTEKTFDRLLDASEALAAERGLQRMEAGVNLNRSGAYRLMLQRGFRTHLQGVAMHKPNSQAYNRPDVYVVDDWR